MESIRRLKSLEVVELAFTKVGDAGLMRLASLPRLKEVSTLRSRITPAGIARFRRERPDVWVHP
jgi:hypothetical protein